MGFSRYHPQFLPDTTDLIKGDQQQIEVMALAGIFKETILEDQDANGVMRNEFEGIIAGHALFELVSGQKLTGRKELCSRNDERRDTFVALLTLMARIKASEDITDLNISTFWKGVKIMRLFEKIKKYQFET